jgi:hypothetical protein
VGKKQKEETKKRRSKGQKESSVYRIIPLPNITIQHSEHGENLNSRINTIQNYHKVTVHAHEYASGHKDAERSEETAQSGFTVGTEWTLVPGRTDTFVAWIDDTALYEGACALTA